MKKTIRIIILAALMCVMLLLSSCEKANCVVCTEECNTKYKIYILGEENYLCKECYNEMNQIKNDFGK